MNDDAEAFGRKMAERRNALGMTQAALAEILGKGGSVSAIQKWEAGRGLPRSGMQARIRAELSMDTSEVETRASWPRRVRDIQETICDLLASLPATEQRRWRTAIIRRTVQGQRTPSPVPWSDDVEVIADILGAYLVQVDYAEETDRT